MLLHGKSIKLENGKTMTFQFKYSSIDSYISEMKVEADKQGVNFSTYNGDFLPLTGMTSDEEEYYLTAQYSHRPLWKSFSRDFSALS